MLIIPAMQLFALLLLPFLNRDASGVLLTQMAVAMLILLGYIDLLTLKVPNALVYPSIAFMLAGTTIVDTGLGLEALIGGAGCLGIMFAIALVGRGAMGMGDVKYGCLVGCILGLRVGTVALASGFVLGAALALPLLLLRIRSRKDSVPLSPFLTVGALFWMLVAGPII
jgi:prepilin signal peptidase PulO-like enzyme (type II secretory pathway)